MLDLNATNAQSILFVGIISVLGGHFGKPGSVLRYFDCVQAAMESLVSGAICGITYHMFSGQPLTVIGSTGPVLVFETIVFNFCK